MVQEYLHTCLIKCILMIIAMLIMNELFSYVMWNSLLTLVLNKWITSKYKGRTY